jgi:hypothetical protein
MLSTRFTELVGCSAPIRGNGRTVESSSGCSRGKCGRGRDSLRIRIFLAGGALAAWQVGSRAEAIAAAQAGCEYLTAQGIAAGGHVRG